MRVSFVRRLMQGTIDTWNWIRNQKIKYLRDLRYSWQMRLDEIFSVDIYDSVRVKWCYSKPVIGSSPQNPCVPEITWWVQWSHICKTGSSRNLLTLILAQRNGILVKKSRCISCRVMSESFSIFVQNDVPMTERAKKYGNFSKVQSLMLQVQSEIW